MQVLLFLDDCALSVRRLHDDLSALAHFHACPKNAVLNQKLGWQRKSLLVGVVVSEFLVIVNLMHVTVKMVGVVVEFTDYVELLRVESIKRVFI